MVSRIDANIAYFNETASSYETPEKVKIAKAAAQSFLSLPWVNFEGKKILDFACGTGLISSFLLPKVGSKGEIIGIDTSEGMVNEYNRRFSGSESKSRAFCCDILSDKPDNSLEKAGFQEFDIVVVSAAYHHIDDSIHATKCLVNRLRSGGKLLVFDLLNDGKTSHHFHNHIPNAKDIVAYEGGMSKDHMQMALHKAGLTNICIEDAYSMEKHVKGIEQDIPFTFFVASGTKPN